MQTGQEPQLGGELRRRRLRFDLERTSAERMRDAQESLARGHRTEAMHHLAGILLDDPDHASARELLDIIQAVEADRDPLTPIVQLLFTVLVTILIAALPSGYLLVHGLSVIDALLTGMPASLGLGFIFIVSFSGLRFAFESSRSAAGAPGCLLIAVPAALIAIVGSVGAAAWLVANRITP